MAIAEQTSNLLNDLLAHSSQTESDSASASGTAATVVMNVRMVSGMMGEMLSGIAQVQKSVQESQERTARSTTDTQAAVVRVANLCIAVDQIAATAGLVRGIAQKTRMLALNAMIESARAGEAGKGFAVVANEVKALSNQTAQATEDVDTQLASIRRANQEVMASVNSIHENLSAIQDLVASVSAAVSEETNSLRTITSCANEAADSVESVATTLDHIAETARLTSEKLRCLDRPVTA